LIGLIIRAFLNRSGSERGLGVDPLATGIGRYHPSKIYDARFCVVRQNARLSQRGRAAVIVLAKRGRLELGDNILRTL